MRHLDQDSAECLVFTYKEGLLSAVAHDLKIRVTRFSIDIDQRARTAEASFDATSLRVVCAMANGKESKGTLSASQKREIEGNIVRDVLAAADFPEIRFKSTAVDDDDDGFRVKGQLALHGKRKTVTVTVRKDGKSHIVTARVHQPDFGIRPYTALLGTLKVKADVDIRIVVP